jgi:hypothetical protein
MEMPSGSFDVPILEQQVRDQSSQLDVGTTAFLQIITDTTSDHHRWCWPWRLRRRHLAPSRWPQSTRPGKRLQDRRGRSWNPSLAKQLPRAHPMGSRRKASSTRDFS